MQKSRNVEITRVNHVHMLLDTNLDFYRPFIPRKHSPNHSIFRFWNVYSSEFDDKGQIFVRTSGFCMFDLVLESWNHKSGATFNLFLYFIYHFQDTAPFRSWRIPSISFPIHQLSYHLRCIIRDRKLRKIRHKRHPPLLLLILSNSLSTAYNWT